MKLRNMELQVTSYLIIEETLCGGGGRALVQVLGAKRCELSLPWRNSQSREAQRQHGNNTAQEEPWQNQEHTTCNRA